MGLLDDIIQLPPIAESSETGRRAYGISCITLPPEIQSLELEPRFNPIQPRFHRQIPSMWASSKMRMLGLFWKTSFFAGTRVAGLVAVVLTKNATVLATGVRV